MKKLVLKKQVLKQLTNSDLRNVVGGPNPPKNLNPPQGSVCNFSG